MLREQLEFIYRGGKTKRFHTSDTHTPQTVSDHSFGVAWFCYLLMAGKPSANLLLAALSHDLAEHLVGDVASPVKRANPILKQALDEAEGTELRKASLIHSLALDAKEERVLKLADCLDGFMYCVRERRFGNAEVDSIANNFHSYIHQMNPVDLEEKLHKIVWEMYQEVNMGGWK